ncbi:PEP-CTERM sorting domain-containing protein [Iodobacter ciconiae]|uniref:PEP-CTERM sorting domain-containing protein n=1 Tax=Iodobacter ciconiae TaxID=2496266 RepID=UPI0019D0DE6E|nr:PEP-CTERM sorting domain-containing protein [Iodobacter ciconiae]
MKPYITIILSTLIIAAPAQAISIKVFTNKTEWTKALNSIVSAEDFTDGSFIQGLSIKANSTKPKDMTHTYSVPGGKMVDRLTKKHSTTISYTSGLLGIGGNFDLSLNDPGMGIKLVLSGDTFSNFVIPTEINKYTTGGFFGLISDTAFSSLKLMAGTQGTPCVNGEQYSLDNLSLATVAAPVPEPETYALMGVGLIGLIAARRRKAQ